MSKSKDILKEFCSLRIGQITLPPDILKELKEIKSRYKLSKLKTLNTKILESLNSFQTDKPFVLPFDQDQSRAYALCRMVNNYGAISNVFNQISRKYPNFKPSSVYDFGCGPGTGIFSAKSYFPITKAEITDVSNSMLVLASELCSKLYPDLKVMIQNNTVRCTNPQSELILCSFTLSELPNDLIRKRVVEYLWNSCSDTLVLVDRGTPVGYELIAKARQQVIDLTTIENEEMHIAAPCPHEKACPLIGSKRYCSFSQKVYLQNFIQNIKENKNNNEDTKFSFVVLKRGKRPEISRSLESQSHHWSKIVFPPMKKNKHVVLDICTTDGVINRMTVPKTRGISYTHARKSYWGDLWPHNHN